MSIRIFEKFLKKRKNIFTYKNKYLKILLTYLIFLYILNSSKQGEYHAEAELQGND